LAKETEIDDLRRKLSTDGTCEREEPIVEMIKDKLKRISEIEYAGLRGQMKDPVVV
jgi:hypothetical protein